MSDAAKTSGDSGVPDRETALDLLGRMVLIRRFEEEAGRQYQRAKATALVIHTAPPANSSSRGVSNEALSTIPITRTTAA